MQRNFEIPFRSNDVEELLGYSLASLFEEADTIRSHIGEYVSGGHSGHKYLRITGMQYDSSYNPTDLLSTTSIQLDSTPKFSNFNGKSPVVILQKYLDASELENQSEYIKNLRDFYDNKLLLAPIKPGDACSVIVPQIIKRERLSDGTYKDITKDSKENTRVDAIKWCTNKETGKLECHILTEVLDAEIPKRGDLKLEEYSEKLFLSDIERSSKSSRKDIIKISRFGYIKPIHIMNKSRGIGIAIDNTTIYSVAGDCIVPIGYWNNANEIVGSEHFDNMVKTPMFKVLSDNIKTIAQHRRYIAPAFLAESTLIEVD